MGLPAREQRWPIVQWRQINIDCHCSIRHVLVIIDGTSDKVAEDASQDQLPSSRIDVSE